MALYKHEATVTCRYAFPIDMLRYDGCYPRREEDSHRIEASIRGEYDGAFEIEIAKRSPEKGISWAYARWESRGCKIQHIETRRLE
jgi:hypothetical protein